MIVYQKILVKFNFTTMKNGPDGSARTPWDRAATPIASVDVEDEVAVGPVNGLRRCRGLYCYW